MKFYNVEDLCANELREYRRLLSNVNAGYLTIGALYRLFISKILSADIEKIIYLDSDIIVNLDINELWKVDLGEKILAAVPEILEAKTAEKMNAFPMCKNGFVKPEDFFNSGVLVMNLNLLRGEEEKILDGVKFLNQNPHCGTFLDQDILNYCFSTKTLKLPMKFNKIVISARLENAIVTEKKIYHYAGKNSWCSFGLDMNDPFNALWMKYFAKTPWFNERIIARLYEKFFQAQAEIKKSAMNLFSAAGGKPRVFIVDKTELDGLKENFSIREDEEIFAVDGTISFWNLVAGMKSLRGQKIFFFLFKSFPFEMLEKAGFVRGKDFVDGFNFSAKNFDTYPFVDAL